MSSSSCCSFFRSCRQAPVHRSQPAALSASRPSGASVGRRSSITGRAKEGLCTPRRCSRAPRNSSSP
eukprot:3303265-Heterocapsa_arctica.AAC.1